MGLFEFLKKSRTEFSDEQKKWNKMWTLWEEGQADSPYAEVMTYQSEINNGGHEQYFFNIGNTGNLQKEIAALDSVISEKLKSNLHSAYDAYLVLEEKEDDKTAEEIIERCDDAYYENEEEINHILKEYAEKIVL